jgi:hypothetical protein
MKKFIFLSIFLLPFTASFGQNKTTNNNILYKGFQSPGNAALPRVWWHWMQGNITKDGIRKDLLWMHRSGIGGFHHFDAGLETPQIVKKRLNFMTPEWKDAFRYTTNLADSLGLEMAIAGSPGWSESGGPWVQPKDGMKKLVWSELRISGGQPFNGQLPKPPSNTGAFQNLPFSTGLDAPAKTPPEFYADVAVVAYRLPKNNISLTDLAPKITSSAGNFTLAQLTDGDLSSSSLLPSDSVKGFAWIQYEFKKPYTTKAITVVGGGDKGMYGSSGQRTEDRILEVSDNGTTFRRVAFIPAGDVLQQTITVPVTTGRYFRIKFKNPPAVANIGAILGIGGGEAPKEETGTDIAEIMLHSNAVIDRFEEKAGYAVAIAKQVGSNADGEENISPSDVIDLTAKMKPDGTLKWTPPGGTWKIIRFGYSLTGKQNHPASPEATGLEVDKLDLGAIKAYFTNYLDQYKSASGGLMGSRGLQYVITDSWEAGAQNWTPAMPQEFQKRRGYNLLSWMPVLTGQIVKSAVESEKFLFDFRQTLSELVAENHYDGLTDILKTYGMKRYSESHESNRALIADGMDVKRTAAVPMSAMWTKNPYVNGNDQTMYTMDIRESASVAHIYGQNLVAAESFTALGNFGYAWIYTPENLKPTADLELAHGLNRFVIHTSTHQPVDDKIPGLALGTFGQWFNRNETWAPYAKTWTDYLARSSYMLQQGKFVADILYYYGEDNNITALFGKKPPHIPEGYDYDFINQHALINLLSVKNGRLVTPSGMSYRILHLDSNALKLSMPVLRKIAQLVKNGAIISGVKPESAASLKDDHQEFQHLVQEIWGNKMTSDVSSSRQVYSGVPLQEVLVKINVQPDFQYIKPTDSTKLLFVHRRLLDEDIYWVNNRSNTNQKVKTTYRVTGKVPQIWHPETGKIELVSYNIADGKTTIDLSLTPNDAVL